MGKLLLAAVEQNRLHNLTTIGLGDYRDYDLTYDHNYDRGFLGHPVLSVSKRL